MSNRCDTRRERHVREPGRALERTLAYGCQFRRTGEIESGELAHAAERGAADFLQLRSADEVDRSHVDALTKRVVVDRHHIGGDYNGCRRTTALFGTIGVRARRLVGVIVLESAAERKRGGPYTCTVAINAVEIDGVCAGEQRRAERTLANGRGPARELHRCKAIVFVKR